MTEIDERHVYIHTKSKNNRMLCYACMCIKKWGSSRSLSVTWYKMTMRMERVASLSTSRITYRRWHLTFRPSGTRDFYTYTTLFFFSPTSNCMSNSKYALYIYARTISFNSLLKKSSRAFPQALHTPRGAAAQRCVVRIVHCVCTHRV